MGRTRGSNSQRGRAKAAAPPPEGPVNSSARARRYGEALPEEIRQNRIDALILGMKINWKQDLSELSAWPENENPLHGQQKKTYRTICQARRELEQLGFDDFDQVIQDIVAETGVQDGGSQGSDDEGAAGAEEGSDSDAAQRDAIYRKNWRIVRLNWNDHFSELDAWPDSGADLSRAQYQAYYKMQDAREELENLGIEDVEGDVIEWCREDGFISSDDVSAPASEVEDVNDAPPSDDGQNEDDDPESTLQDDGQYESDKRDTSARKRPRTKRPRHIERDTDDDDDDDDGVASDDLSQYDAKIVRGAKIRLGKEPARKKPQFYGMPRMAVPPAAARKSNVAEPAHSLRRTQEEVTRPSTSQRGHRARPALAAVEEARTAEDDGYDVDDEREGGRPRVYYEHYADDDMQVDEDPAPLAPVRPAALRGPSQPSGSTSGAARAHKRARPDDFTDDEPDRPPPPDRGAAGSRMQHGIPDPRRRGNPLPLRSPLARRERPPAHMRSQQPIAWKDPVWRRGAAPPRERDTHADSFAEPVTGLIIRAQKRYKGRILNIEAFPNDALKIKWAREVWADECAHSDLYYKENPTIWRLIYISGSNARSDLLRVVRVHGPSAYGLISRLDTEAERLNEVSRLVRWLLHDHRWLYRLKGNRRGGFAEHAIVYKVLEAAYFRTKRDCGVKYSCEFEPFTIAAHALVFTLVEYMLSEIWAEGKEKIKPKHFSEVEWEPRYRLCRQNLSEAFRGREAFMARRGARLYKNTRKSTGAPNKVDLSAGLLSGAHLARVRSSVGDRTGDTESEGEEADAGLGGDDD